MSRKIVYVCSKLRGDINANIRNAQRLCRTVVKMGHIPVAPHLLLTQFLDPRNEVEDQLGREAAIDLLNIADEIWVDTANGISSGMQAEIDHANQHDIPIVNGIAPDTESDDLLDRLITNFRPPTR